MGKRIKKNEDKIAKCDKEIETVQKYIKRIDTFKEGYKTIQKGKGIYTQPKRNAYKINSKNGGYGELTIDIPKLIGQLRLVA